MKTRGRMMTIALAITVALMAVPAMAQTINVKADVPFDFAVDKATLRSGHCTVQTITNDVVRLSDADHNSSAVIMIPDDLRSAEDTKLVFNRYGDLYFLARIETPEASYKVPISKREMRLANEASPRQVAVLADAGR